ncbi:hypothetical protein M0D69_04555 [Caballeronia sp. SEWSISQ10-4 2]|uniref:hypothetical protein n=1 Tax=Caballeronia sp. SEWSISQ10-4 2 TaxID=2937438 RepID=UPI002654E412|nr:hypothetical protein [Caballeronia sp. SEWSISQ10-4 2]MDN7177294.1 hypothetical protein [Caballeronia sp. SEWSISQ10-4 2]
MAIALTQAGETLVAQLMPIAQHFEEVAVGELSKTTLKVFKKTRSPTFARNSIRSRTRWNFLPLKNKVL